MVVQPWRSATATPMPSTLEAGTRLHRATTASVARSTSDCLLAIPASSSATISTVWRIWLGPDHLNVAALLYHACSFGYTDNGPGRDLCVES